MQLPFLSASHGKRQRLRLQCWTITVLVTLTLTVSCTATSRNRGPTSTVFKISNAKAEFLPSARPDISPSHHLYHYPPAKTDEALSNKWKTTEDVRKTKWWHHFYSIVERLCLRADTAFLLMPPKVQTRYLLQGGPALDMLNGCLYDLQDVLLEDTHKATVHLLYQHGIQDYLARVRRRVHELTMHQRNGRTPLPYEVPVTEGEERRHEDLHNALVLFEAANPIRDHDLSLLMDRDREELGRTMPDWVTTIVHPALRDIKDIQEFK